MSNMARRIPHEPIKLERTCEMVQNGERFAFRLHFETLLRGRRLPLFNQYAVEVLKKLEHEVANVTLPKGK